MARPRSADKPAQYMNAKDVLPEALMQKAITKLAAHPTQGHRVLTFSYDRQTQARRLLGEDLYLGICAVMHKKYPHTNSWRVYFQRDIDMPDYEAAYARAASLMRAGYSRRVTAIVTGVSLASLKRRVSVPYTETQSLNPVTPAEVDAGYRYMAVSGHLEDAASTVTCGLVGRALGELDAS